MDYMGARRGWQELAVPHPWKIGKKIYYMGGLFITFFLLMGGLFLHVGAFLSPYGEPFNEIN